MDKIIEVRNLSYTFNKTQALKNLSVNFEENKIYGLLGKNGAGKTTLINIITRQLINKEGEIKIFGKSINEDITLLNDLCIVKEREFYNLDKKGRDVLDIYSLFYKDYDKELEKKLCDFFELPLKKSYKKYSRGMKTLISNIIGICSNAKITIFDEPTIGLDAVNREHFYNILLEEYIKKPRTIIISTHLIEEVDNLLEHVVIVNKGEVILDEDIDNIKQKSYFITGKKEDLSSLKILNDKKPKQEFGSTEVYSYYGELSDEDLNTIDELNINLEPMGLQKLFIEMTKGKDY
ncbi:ATP-binding cassette domain-containing protein [Clostridium ihumii]|uniref:ATP-binding cassette domain-containing protein n=1 Tax=Clostridium ihumii TaxID=1470356 RepID=UPI003D327A62